MTLESNFSELLDESTSLKHSELLQLTGLSIDEVVEFISAWHPISQPRKKAILSNLVELGEDNLELDFSAVFRACLKDEDADVRETATKGLWESDDRAIIRPLIGLLHDDPSPKVRAASAIGLGKFADLAQDGKVLRRDGARVREALLAVLAHEDEDREVRRRAIEAVGSFNSPEVKDIIQQAYGDGDITLKQSAIYAMGRTSDVRWLSTVLDDTHHENASIRYEAANASGQLGEESTVPHMIRLIEDEDPQVQLAAIQALGSIGGPLAKRALLQCMKLDDDFLEEAAKSALEDIEFDEEPIGF